MEGMVVVGSKQSSLFHQNIEEKKNSSRYGDKSRRQEYMGEGKVKHGRKAEGKVAGREGMVVGGHGTVYMELAEKAWLMGTETAGRQIPAGSRQAGSR